MNWRKDKKQKKEYVSHYLCLKEFFGENEKKKFLKIKINKNCTIPPSKILSYLYTN